MSPDVQDRDRLTGVFEDGREILSGASLGLPFFAPAVCQSLYGIVCENPTVSPCCHFVEFTEFCVCDIMNKVDLRGRRAFCSALHKKIINQHVHGYSMSTLQTSTPIA